ncbi:MAG TPA: hypothetical protein DEG17_04535 [Cyanobacteria bacterium UBA11149]|nr:hypothetical protein [Cyanobacteria bacterium UBA11367]HBK64899.1 hypothetical protein [Cyanobacteria bacterium UBA11166]HBR73011.1 hypothetical protein [Cyanobacteria bacterium UBA11159]HBS68903.1 hypothetical protein [Cyanobacteria bacterium UBA11153]HBW88158.1 hypothetical protein [Cyanobacteria bacterium UBA11149]HCA97201.1 hypothetical protein [Cyanobacteria bacterium UBA9226]
MDDRFKKNIKFIGNAFGLIGLMAMAIAVTAIYVSKEHNFYWWIDWYNATIQVADTFRESPSEAIEEILDSLIYERNRIYTLPLIPFILIFGKSRIVYEIGLALVYLVPFALVMGAIATRLIPVHREVIFWLTAFLTLLIPINWMATFLGIPDTGGAFFIGMAAFLYLQDMKLKQWWRILLIGMAIGLAVVLRRHFVYGGIALLGAMTVQTVILIVNELRGKREEGRGEREEEKKRRRWQRNKRQKSIKMLSSITSYLSPLIYWFNLLSIGIKIILIGLISLATLWIIAPEFTYQALTTNYRHLYASWTLPFTDIFQLYAAFYGWITWLLVAIGFSASILTRSVPFPVASLMGIWGIFALIIWLGVLRYTNVFYALHVTPLLIIGLVALIWTTWTRLTGKIRTTMLTLVTCYLLINFGIGFTSIGKFDNVFRPLFAVNMPPLVRTDYNEVVRLVNYLREIAPHGEAIYVVGYQRLQLNLSAVKAAERVLYPPDERILNIMRSPQVDSQDTYPLETLLQAQYVVVPNPLPDFPTDLTKAPVVGEWLPDKEVDVVQVVFDAFTQNWDIAQDFKPLPQEFTLSGDAKVKIYQRIRPTSMVTAIETLASMEKKIGVKPGGQLDWIVVSQPGSNSLIDRNPDRTYSLATQHFNDVREVGLLGAKNLKKNRSANESSTSFLYLGSLPEKAKVTGTITFPQEPCFPLSVGLAMVNKEGKIVGTSQFTKKEYFSENSADFILSIQGKNPAYLLLDVSTLDTNQTMNYCKIDIDSLNVSRE